jgi:hypothetical protein
VSVGAKIESRGGIWRRAEPASEVELRKLCAALQRALPNDYLEFLRFSNGGEGDLGVKPGWFCPWRAEDVVAHNESYRVSESYGEFLGFGSNGGGELIAFDCRGSEPWPIVMIPFIGGTQHVERIADDFVSFLASVGRPIERADA